MPSWITRIESHLGSPLVGGLRKLYENGDGEPAADAYGRPGPASEGRPLRLMSAEEVIEKFDRFREFVPLRGSALFWSGDNGEFAAAFLKGPLTGRFYIFDYDGRNDSVAFRSPQSFVESMNEAAAAGAGWHDLRTDYYVDTEYFVHGDATCKPATNDEIASDREAARELRAEYAAATIEDERDHHHYALNIMGLTPAAHTESIYEFLDSDDMWIQERACNILGHRKHEAAIARLGEVSRAGTTNGRGAALDALGRIGTPAALEQVLTSAPHFGRDHWRLSKALERCGCEVRKDNIDPRGINSPDFLYRLPGESDWRRL